MTDYKKLYKDAIFRMNKWVEGSEIIDPKEVAEFVFPELKESEDEKIRKDIISFVKHAINDGYGIISKEREEKWIAWLEKQGENHIVENNEKVYATSEQIPANSAKTCKDEQKPAWSEEEDETVLNNLIYALANDIIGNCRDEYVDWLKSLKDRI